MKKYHINGGLLNATACTSADCSVLLKVPSPTAEPEKTQQAKLSTAQNIPVNTPCQIIRILKKYKRNLSTLMGFLWVFLLARFYETEKKQQNPRLNVDDEYFFPESKKKEQPSNRGLAL